MGSEEKRALNSGTVKTGAYRSEGDRHVESNASREESLLLDRYSNFVQREAADPEAQPEEQESARTSQAVDQSNGARNPAPQDGQAVPDKTEQPGKPPEAGAPTPEQIAERVYELFRRDLRVTLERKGY